MKAVALVVFVAVSVYFVSGEDDPKGYTGKLAQIDVEAILNNQRILKSYLNCFLDKGPCTSEGREAKSKLLYYFMLYLVYNYLFISTVTANFTLCGNFFNIYIKIILKIIFYGRN